MIRHKEVCREWAEPYPDQPVNSLPLAIKFLEESSKAWFSSGGRERGELERDEYALRTAQRDLLNIRHTLEWLYRLRQLDSEPNWDPEPKTAQDAYAQRAKLLRWCKECQKRQPRPNGLGRKPLSISEVEWRFEVWCCWQGALKRKLTCQQFCNEWNSQPDVRHITPRIVDSCRSFVRGRIASGSVPQKYAKNSVIEKMRRNK
jgi:hypothetical protein